MIGNGLFWRGALAASVVVAMFVGCTSEPPEPEKNELVIEPIVGMKYYVGGPVMKADRYGRLRLSGFNGEVSAPTSRGLLIGIQIDDTKHFDYRTWLNGLAVSQSTGFLDQDGLLWYTHRSTFDGNGRIVARQSFEYDDSRLVMTSLLEHLDPETTEVVRSHREELPYAPVEDEEDEDEEETEDPENGREGRNGTGANKGGGE
jgi:hypothetical protein